MRCGDGFGRTLAEAYWMELNDIERRGRKKWVTWSCRDAELSYDVGRNGIASIGRCQDIQLLNVTWL